MDPIIRDILERGIVNIIPGKGELEKALTSGKKLNIYLGIDPTATRIHIGHSVPLRKLQKLSELGHNVTFLIGDFTALIGDTSDKDTERPVLTYEQIQENFKTYKAQAEKILDYTKISVVFNSSWLNTLSFADIVSLCQYFSVGDFTSRELIKKRLESGSRVGLHEMLYPVMQGYDSYHLDTDIQIGAADQTFNMQAGRTLQKVLREKDSFVLVNDYLQGTDGRKMSKSWGNAIWLDDEPMEMYGKVMSLSDDSIIPYYTLGTNIPLEEIAEIKAQLDGGVHPMDIKKRLAYTIVAELHSKEAAEEAQTHFEQTFQKGAPTNWVETPIEANTPLVALISDIAGSTSEAKRLIAQNAVDINGTLITDPKHTLTGGEEIKIGKRTFIKTVLK